MRALAHAAEDFDGPSPRGLIIFVVRALLRRRLPLSEAQVLALLWLAAEQGRGVSSYWGILPGVVSAAVNRVEAAGLSEPVREAICTLVAHVARHPEFPDYRKAADRLSALLSEGPHVTMLPGEAWSDTALTDLAAMSASDRQHWNELLAHCQSMSGAKPTALWLRESANMIEKVGFPQFKRQLMRWFPLVDRPRTAPLQPPQPWLPDQTHLIQPSHVDLLRGLVWCCCSFDDPELAQTTAQLAISSYRKLPGKGARLETIGNSCIAALRLIPGDAAIGPFMLLKAKVKFGKAEQEIETALAAAAEKTGLPRDDLDELGVPTYGLQDVGRRREVVGEYGALLSVSGSDVDLRWLKADGKPLKSLPASLKNEHAERVKELRDAVKTVRLMLGRSANVSTGYSWPANPGHLLSGASVIVTIRWSERSRDL